MEDDIRYVCANMREIDAVEQFATRFPCGDEPAALARDMIERRQVSILSQCFTAAEPATILSAYLISPGVAKLHRISTNEWAKVSLEVFRFGVEYFVPVLTKSGIRRAECSILAAHDIAAQILIKLGFEREGIARARGRGGEDFLNFARVLA